MDTWHSKVYFQRPFQYTCKIYTLKVRILVQAGSLWCSSIIDYLVDKSLKDVKSAGVPTNCSICPAGCLYSARLIWEGWSRDSGQSTRAQKHWCRNFEPQELISFVTACRSSFLLYWSAQTLYSAGTRMLSKHLHRLCIVICTIGMTKQLYFSSSSKTSPKMPYRLYQQSRTVDQTWFCDPCSCGILDLTSANLQLLQHIHRWLHQQLSLLREVSVAHCCISNYCRFHSAWTNFSFCCKLVNISEMKEICKCWYFNVIA